MNRRLHGVQIALLALGTLSSWTTLVFDYRRFFAAGGRALEISGCVVANPIVTPCFYGAIGFLVALLWSIVIFRSARASANTTQRGLHWLLLAATLFASGNFAYEVYLYLQPHAGRGSFGCPPGVTTGNPLLASCFYGALILGAALVNSALILSRVDRVPASSTG